MVNVSELSVHLWPNQQKPEVGFTCCKHDRRLSNTMGREGSFQKNKIDNWLKKHHKISINISTVIIK